MIKVKKLMFIILLMFLSITLIGCNDSSNATNKDQAPMFELSDVNGNKIALEDLSGKKVYIKYWASWCSACLAGLEELDQLSSEENDFEVLTIVSPDYNGEMNASDFSNWFEALNYENITVLLDEDGVWSKQYQVPAYPASYYIDSSGELIKEILGHNPNDAIKSEIAKID